MYRRNAVKAVVATSVVALAMPVLAGTASAKPAPKAPSVSFSASNDGASAGWSHGKGSAIDLTLGSDSATTFAEVTLKNIEAVSVGELSEPFFATDNYNAGSPRWYVTLSDGNSLWGVPPNSGLNGTDFAWQVDNNGPYDTWSDMQSAEGGATVTGAYVIADGDQLPGVTDQITALTFDGTNFTK